MTGFCEIVVIADDLTGAADTGAQFCPVVGPVCMVGADTLHRYAEEPPSSGLAVFTNTRNATAEAAGRVVGDVAEYIKSCGYRTVYKKIDSCLRGNIGAEIDMLIAKLGCPVSFVAPALPSQQRVTINDLHTVNGIPVAESEAGRDLLSPVRESRLSELLATQSSFKVGHVDLDCIEKGADAVSERVVTLFAGGCRHIAFDASCDAHLFAVASLAFSPFPGCLMVGSAGLASALARAMMSRTGTVAALERPKIRKPLFVCGSASAMLAAQREELLRVPGMKEVMVDPGKLVFPGEKEISKKRCEKIAAEWQGGGLVLSITPCSSENPVLNPESVIQGFSELAAAVIERSSPDLVFLSGGDTAEAVYGRMGADAIYLVEEILPGLVRGELAGGEFKGLAVVTKAGSFGSPQTLVTLMKIIYQQ